MDVLLREAAAFIRKHWHSWRGGVAFVALAALVSLPTTAGLITWQREALALAACTVASSVWLGSNRIPRTSRNRIGFLLAIACENDQHEKELRLDFIQHLREQLLQGRGAAEENPAHPDIELLVCPRWRAERLVTQEDALHLTTKSRAHVCVWGNVRERVTEAGEDALYIRLEGLVRHGPTSPTNQESLAKEFSEYLPRRLQVPRAGSLLKLEVASEWLELAARYVVGIAALLSHAPVLCEQQLLVVEDKISRFRARIPALSAIARNLPERFETLYSTWLNYLTIQLTLKRKRELAVQAELVADKLLVRKPDSYPANLSKAFAAFLLRRDVSVARSHIAKCRRIKDAAWRYSAAFLYAWEGNLSKAHEEYVRAFRAKTNDPTLPLQCEEFIQLILEEEPNRYQLHFCSGLINLHAKSDMAAARHDFQAFLDVVDPTRYVKEQEIARDYIADIDQRDLNFSGDVPFVDYQLRPIESDEKTQRR